MISSGIKITLVGICVVFLGAIGYLGTACASALYADHLLLNQIRANALAQQQQQAEQIQQFRQQQQAQQAAPVPAPAPVK